MSPTLGIIAAFVALLSWGFGDFSIQRSVRRAGTLETLFFIGAIGGLLLLPFSWQHLSKLWENNHALWLFLITLGVTLVTAIVNFEAFKKGKLAVVEPVMSLELIATVFIGIIILKEKVTGLQLMLIFTVFIGILLTAVKTAKKPWWQFWKKNKILEAGVILAAGSAFFMSLTNIYTGLASRIISPLAIICFIHLSLALIVFIWFVYKRKVGQLFTWSFTHWRPVLAASLLDTLAWVAFSFAVIALPISITIAITESYIALAAFLGIVVNKEKLLRHQYAGMTIALTAAIILAIFSA